MRCVLLLLCSLPFLLRAGEAPVEPASVTDTLYGKRAGAWADHLRAYENEKERTLALYCLSEFGPAAAEALPELRALLKEELQPNIPARVLDTLASIGKPAAPAIPDLLELYSDKQRTERFHASVLETMARIDPHHAQVRRAWQNALRHESDVLRHAALDAAFYFASVEQSALQTLTRALSVPGDAPVAARTLSSLGSAGVNALLKALEKDPVARLAAAEAIKPHGSDAASAVPLLLRLAERDRDNRGGFVDAAQALAPRDPAVLELVAMDVATGAQFAAPPAGENPKPYAADLRRLAAAGNDAIPAVRAGLRSPLPQARLAFVELLARLKEPPAEAIDILIARAQDKDEAVRLAAIHALDVFGPRAAQARTALEDIARDDAAVRRAALLAALNVARAEGAPRLRSTFEARGVDETLAALKSADARERRDAAEGLRARKENEPAIAAALIEALNDADDDVRVAAARALAFYGSHSAAALPVFVEWLNAAAGAVKKDEKITARATGALAGLAGMAGGAKPALAAMTSLAVSPAVDGEKDLQRVLAISLRIVGTDSVAPFIAQFKNDDAAVRRRAAETLAQMGPVGATAIPDLLQLSNSVVESDARAAFSAIESMGLIAYPLAAPSLADTLTGDLFAERRRYAAQTLGGIGIPPDGDKHRVLDALQHALLDPEEFVCRAAHGAMVRIGPPALPRLKEMLDLGEGAASYWWAVRALARLKAEPEKVIPLLADLARPGVRTVKAGAFAEQGVAAELLGNYAPERTEMLPVLLRCLGDREEYVANAAIRSLKLFGPEVVVHIKPLLGHPDPRFRRGAARALLALQSP